MRAEGGNGRKERGWRMERKDRTRGRIFRGVYKDSSKLGGCLLKLSSLSLQLLFILFFFLQVFVHENLH